MSRRREIEGVLAQARAMVRRPDLAVLDTETTGLDGMAEVVELAIIDGAGAVLLQRLVKPTRPVPSAATAIHGIGNADLADAPGMGELEGELQEALGGRFVVAYNLAFDLRVLNQSRAAVGLGPLYGDDFFHPGNPIKDSACLMQLYAPYHRERKAGYASYTWQSLDAAVSQCGLAFEGEAHRALTDAKAALALLKHLGAGWPGVTG